jgi:hypothetical protein
MNKLNNYMEQNPPWESNRSSAIQEISRILWNTMVHYPFYNSPYPEPDQ